MRRGSRATVIEPERPDVDVSNVINRLDAVIDRLEGVYERLKPYLIDGSPIDPTTPNGSGAHV
jgi:hypothetical protein